MKSSLSHAVVSSILLMAGLTLAAGGGPALAGQYQSRPFTEAELTVSRAYIAYYGRAADPGGLAYWSNRLNNEGGDLSSIIQAFGYSQEFNDRFGDLGTQELIRNLYQQLFNRQPDPGGLAYYTGELTAGRKSLQTIALNILYGATGSDVSIIENKLAVAQYFTSAIEVAPGAAVSALDADALAAMVAKADGDGTALPSLYCQTRSVIYGEVSGALDGRSPAQQAFISARGYPALFTVSFITEAVNDNGRLAQLDLPRRQDSWAFDGARFVGTWFENGYFVEETDFGGRVGLPPAPLRPDQFTLCMDANDIVALIGYPSCEDVLEMGGREYRILRFEATEGRPPVSVALENGLLNAVTVGYAIADPASASQSLCE
jgi:hypothetical protein